MHHRGAELPGDLPRLPPPGGERQRRSHPCGRPQADVFLEGSRVPEDVEQPERRVAERVETDPVFDRTPAELRVPRQHDVDLMPAPGDSVGNRLHERADRVAWEARVRCRDHDNDFAAGRLGGWRHVITLP